MIKSEYNTKLVSALDISKIKDSIFLLKKELFNLRCQKKLGDLTNTSRFCTVRRDVARLKTELSKRERS